MRVHALALTLIAALAVPVAAEAQTAPAPAATQLFLAPTGRVAPKGQGYFKMVGLGVPFGQGSLTDRLSIGVGAPIFGLGEIAVISGKFQVQRSLRHSTAIGAVGLVTTGGSGGVGYVAHTAELPSGAVHLAVIRPLDRHYGGPPVIMLGAEGRVSDRVTFITENYVVLGARPLVSGGLRVRNRSVVVDLGLMLQPELEFGLPLAPIISVGWKF